MIFPENYLISNCLIQVFQMQTRTYLFISKINGWQINKSFPYHDAFYVLFNVFFIFIIIFEFINYMITYTLSIISNKKRYRPSKDLYLFFKNSNLRFFKVFKVNSKNSEDYLMSTNISTKEYRLSQWFPIVKICRENGMTLNIYLLIFFLYFFIAFFHQFVEITFI